MEKPKERGKLKFRMENEIIKKRERQYNYDQMWRGAAKYFQHWEKTNTKYDSWTSPRYYEDNTKFMLEMKHKKDKEELLKKRREKLRKLLHEEQQSWEIELMVLKNKLVEEPKIEGISTDVLKEVNNEMKLKEQERRRHEAELKLYHQWRKNNPIVRQYESKYKLKDLKLSWLDQQIEKRIQKERDEEEMKKMLKEQEERIKVEEAKETQFKKYIEEKQQQIKKCLEEQMAELKKQQENTDKLKQLEDGELKKKLAVAEIEEKYQLEEKRRTERECALFNLRQHKLKLKQKSADIQENLKQEKLLLNQLRQLDLEKIIEDETRKNVIKRELTEFLNIIKQQQDLEIQRQKHLEFLFDSEVKVVYEKQCDIWSQEELARQNLIKEVLFTIQEQITSNLSNNREKQKQILQEREKLTFQIEEYNKELQKIKEEEDSLKSNNKQIIEDEIKLKKLKKKQQENLKLKEINEELDRIKKEEERLQQEILKLQQKHVPVKPPRSSRLFF